METDGNITAAVRNRTHYRHSQASSQGHEFFHPNAVFVATVTATSVILVLAVCLVILLSRRQRSTGKNGGSDGNQGIGIGYAAQNSTHSPEVKPGCLSGSSTIGLAAAGAGLNRGRQNRGSRGVQVFTYKDLEAATNGFNEANVIGNGNFGFVYRGVLNDGTLAAIKMLHKEGKQGERAFRTEVDLLSRLQSSYLVELLGYCADQSHRLLIFEYMPHGSLRQHLHLTRTQYVSLDWGTRLRIALDCARALEYLHEHTTPSVIHRNFNCSNVLLGHDFRAKVSDFGLAKMGSDKINGQVSTRVLGTTGYLAPEYTSTGKLTTKSDVYSYGVVLLELLTGRVPVDSRKPPEEQALVSWALPRLTNRDKVVEMVDPILKGNYSKKELIQVYCFPCVIKSFQEHVVEYFTFLQVAAIAAVCVQPEAGYRPLMVDIVQSLIPLVKNYNTSTPSMIFLNNVV